MLSGLRLTTALSCPTLAGCTLSDPRIDKPPGLPPAAAGDTVPGLLAGSVAADGERQLAELAAAILTGPRHTELTSPQRRLLLVAQQAHLEHSTALQAPKPTTRPLPVGPAPTPSASALPVGVPLIRLFGLFAATERAQAARLRRAALAKTGFDALLWGSMAVAASSFASAAGPPSAQPGAAPAPRATKPLPMAAVSDAAALQAMVAQLHAMVYGYQLALGRLSRVTSAGRRARSGLHSRRALRNLLTQALLDRSADVPVAAPAYRPSVQVTSAATAGELVGAMEVALEPFCGLWLASAATSADRMLAMDALADTTAKARSWGAPLTVWPGWQS